jgi:hypothetical protein
MQTIEREAARVEPHPMATSPFGTYEVDNRASRIMQACLILLLAVLPFALFRNGLWLALSVGCLVWAWQRLDRPYEVHIYPSGRLRVLRVAGTTELHATDITAVVRQINRSNDSQRHFRVEHRGGSFTMETDRGDIAHRFEVLNPAAAFRTEEYDDTD